MSVIVMMVDSMPIWLVSLTYDSALDQAFLQFLAYSLHLNFPDSSCIVSLRYGFYTEITA